MALIEYICPECGFEHHIEKPTPSPLTELDEILNDLTSTVEWCIDPQRLSGVYVDRDKAEKAKVKAKAALTQLIARKEREARIDELQEACKKGGLDHAYFSNKMTDLNKLSELQGENK